MFFLRCFCFSTTSIKAIEIENSIRNGLDMSWNCCTCRNQSRDNGFEFDIIDYMYVVMRSSKYFYHCLHYIIILEDLRIVRPFLASWRDGP